MCDCIQQVEAEINQKNTTFEKATMISMEGVLRESVIIATTRLRTSTPQERRTKIIRVVPSYCPFCGTRIENTGTQPASAAATDSQ
jgi:hypothetical protein